MVCRTQELLQKNIDHPRCREARVRDCNEKPAHHKAERSGGGLAVESPAPAIRGNALNNHLEKAIMLDDLQILFGLGMLSFC